MIVESTAIAAGAAWLWDKLGKEILTKSAGAANNGWKKLNWSRLASAYFTSIRSHYSSVTLLGKHKQIDLSSTFTDVYAYD